MDVPLDWEEAAQQAKQAALQGRWDQVQDYYAQREGWFNHPGMAASTAAGLAAIDREIESMILVARAAAGSVLDDASSAKRAVGQLRAKLSAGVGFQSTVSRRI
jgi:hypothetical protein